MIIAITLNQILVYAGYGVGAVFVIGFLILLNGILRGNKNEEKPSKADKAAAKNEKKASKNATTFNPNVSTNFLGNAPAADTFAPATPFQAPVAQQPVAPQVVAQQVPQFQAPVVPQYQAPVAPAQPVTPAVPVRPVFGSGNFSLDDGVNEDAPKPKQESRFNLPF